ncbi:ArpA protein [Legionella busanensis]|uniref:ArpA protein n=1 Tax=Legionella busanensis TaxID=190655 RepID=A0A378JK23_9GAMM|nr:ArpA protein [Legionella busanensis]STX51575.1 ArpA protein [Legionella busanensis]
MNTINDTISMHANSVFTEKKIRALREQFSRQGMVKIPNIVSENLKKKVHNEIYNLLEKYAERRDLLLKTTDNTPRYLSVVRSELIEEHSMTIKHIRESADLLMFLEKITQERLLIDVKEDEKFVITKQEFSGDTHGWHWGDYSFALIWIVEMPPVDCGGMLQCVPHTSWDKESPDVHQYFCDNPISTYSFVPGDVYLLKADTTLHRTLPLRYNATRIMLNMTWASMRDQANPFLTVDDRWWDNVNAQAAQHV